MCKYARGNWESTLGMSPSPKCGKTNWYVETRTGMYKYLVINYLFQVGIIELLGEHLFN